MKKYFLFFIIIVIIPITLFSQINKDGLPIIEKYTDADYGEAGQVWAIAQDKRGIMYFGNNYGLKTYDGKKWKDYNNPHSTMIKSLAIDDNGLVYYGAESDFGIMEPNSIGELKFHSFYLDKHTGEINNFGSIWKTLLSDNKIFFQSFEKLHYCNLPIEFDDKGKLVNEIHTISPKTKFHLSFSVDNEFYIREWERGLYRVTDNQMELIPGGEMFALLKVYVMLPYDKTRILIGTQEKGFFLYDKTKTKNAITPFNIKGYDKTIIESFIYSGQILSNGNFAIATRANGIFIFNKKGQITNHLNEATSGIPQQFVLSMYSNKNDPSGILWFFSQENGIYKVDMSGVFNLWNEKTGLEGSVDNIIRFKGKLYVTASPFLYYLKENRKSNSNFVKIYGEPYYNIWDMCKFIVPGTNEQKLLMGTPSGLFEVADTIVNTILKEGHIFTMFQSINNPERLYFGNKQGLSYLTYKNNKWSKPIRQKSILYPIKNILETKEYIANGSPNRGVLLIKDFNSKFSTLIDSSRGLPLLGEDFSLQKINNKIVIASGGGLFAFKDTSEVEPFDFFGKDLCNKTTGVFRITEDQDGYWMSVFKTEDQTAKHRLLRFKGKVNPKKDSAFAKILPQKITFSIYPDGDYVWVANEKGLYKFNKKIDKNYKAKFYTLISKVQTKNDSLLFADSYKQSTDSGLLIVNTQDINNIPKLDFKNNELNFEWAAPFFEKEDETLFSFRLLGESAKWSKWNKKNDTRFTNLYEGDYTFEVKAKNIYNVESVVAQYSFSVLPPWYRTIWAYVIFGILGILLVLLLIKLYTKKLKRENEKLEQTVKERTSEIRQQNEEITAQRDEIHAQKEEVEKSKAKIEKQQKSILDSIHYASRIQEAVLPPEEFLKEILGEHFVLFKPRDIVSGDFYWATKRGNKTVIVAADSTGHGVPGAFMSMLGISFLNEIVNKEEVLQANQILNRLRENVKRSLRQTGKDNEAKDGMDLALCIIDTDEMTLQFAGAYNPLYILRDGEISRVKADRMPIGIYLREKESFTNNIVKIQKGDLLYIFSDGYVDQFGGEKDSKIRSAKFKELLIENHKKPLEAQKAGLVEFLDFWMNHVDKTGRKYKQVDDILVIGIEI